MRNKDDIYPLLKLNAPLHPFLLGYHLRMLLGTVLFTILDNRQKLSP